MARVLMISGSLRSRSTNAAVLRTAAGAHAELRAVLGYAHAAIVEAACANVPITSAMIGDDGLIDDEPTRAAIAAAVAALAAA